MDGTIYQFERLPMANGAAPPVRADAMPQAGATDGVDLIGVIRNPRSHRNKGLVPEMADRPEVITRTPATREDLANDLADFARMGVALLAVDGGDGTVRDVLTCGAPVYGDAWPRLAVLPKGKTNALAVDLGLPNHWSLCEAIASHRANRLIERRPIIVSRSDSAAGKSDGRVIGFILGAGLFTTATNTGQVAHKFGAFNSFAVAVTAVAGILQGLFGIGRTGWRGTTAMRVMAGSPGQEVPRSRHYRPDERFVVLLSTLNDFPLGMKPFGPPADGIKYLVVDHPLRRVMALAPLLLAGWEGVDWPKLGVHRGHADNVLLEVDDKFIVDGEAFPPGRYDLSLGPKLQFVVP